MKQSPHWAQMQEWSLLWGMRLLFGIYRLLGRKTLQLFLYPVVIYYWLLNGTARRASRDYLDRVGRLLPNCGLHGGLWWSYRHFISFANAIIDKLAAWAGLLSLNDVEFQGRERLLADLDQGRGAVLFGSHLGNPEVCRVIACLDPAIKINVLVHTKHAEKFNRLLSLYNPNSSLNLLQVTEVNAATAMLLAEKIEQGELVIIAADRTPVGGGQRVTRVEFLGAPALFPQGPFILAALLKCPVYNLFCLKRADKDMVNNNFPELVDGLHPFTPGEEVKNTTTADVNSGWNPKHAIIFEHFSDALNWPRASREQAIQQAAQRYAERLQRYCLQAPLQWFNFYDFWRI